MTTVSMKVRVSLVGRDGETIGAVDDVLDIPISDEDREAGLESAVIDDYVYQWASRWTRITSRRIASEEEND